MEGLIEITESNKNKHDIKTMCNVLGVVRSTYYKSFDKTKSRREIENDELRIDIKLIYTENKGLYGVPRVHHMLNKEGFEISLKIVQKLIKEIEFYEKTVKSIDFN